MEEDPEIDIDEELVLEVEEIIMKTIKEKFPKNPEEVAMALQKSSIAIQEIIRVYIPDEDIKEMREIVREKIEEEIQNLRQLSESQQIMYQ